MITNLFSSQNHTAEYISNQTLFPGVNSTILAQLPVITMRNLSKTYKNAAGEFAALKNINTEFVSGEFVGVIGKSGSGKSTLANMITGIDRPTSGEIIINDTPVHLLNESDMARWRGRNLGIVFQFYQLLPMLSLLENVMLPMDFTNKLSLAEREKRALALLKMVGLEEQAYKMPAAVSGGQQQAAAIARALANDPPLIIADEPTGNLDSRTAETIMEIFENLVTNGKTIIMVTHDPALARRTTRTLLIADGEIINDTIAQAFPMLSHTQMLKATKCLTPLKYEAGSTIIHQGEAVEMLYIVSKGQVEIAIEDPSGNAQVITHLNPGEHFGEVELLQENRRAIATVRASNTKPVEMIAIDNQTLKELLAETTPLKENLLQVVQNRIAENLAAFSKGVRHAQTALA